MKEARDFRVEWTPRGWMREDLDLLGFEQQLYLRQPGYGTSYTTGKYLIERLMKDRAKQLGDAFTLAGEGSVYQHGDVALSGENTDCSGHRTPLFVFRSVIQKRWAEEGWAR